MNQENEVLHDQNQAQDLASLEAMAAGDEIKAPGEEKPPAIDQAKAWAMLPQTAGGILCMFLPELRQVYSQENCQAWGELMQPVAQARGWDAEEVMGPEAMLAVSTFAMFVVPTWMAIKARGPQVQTKPGPAAAPGDEVTSAPVLDGLAGATVPPVQE